MSQRKRVKTFSLIPLIAGMLFVSTLAHAAAYYNVGAWFKTQFNKLVITTSAQSIYAGNCSGAVTVVNKNPFGTTKNVTSNLTVNLSGPASLTFYSDSACTIAITSTTIPSGSNTVNVYFIDTAVESATITASATSYQSGTQTETLSTNPYVWTGGGANAQWSTAANWSGGAAPGSSAVALFTGSACTTNCSPTISSSINIGGIRLNSDYAGTITQSAGKTVTVGTKGWVQLAGSFVGSSSGDAITVGDSNLIINGGTFTSTSGTLQFGDAAGQPPLTFTVASGATFNHNSGLFYVRGTCATHAISTASATFNNVKFDGNCPVFTLSGTMNIAGNLDFSNPGFGGNFNSGTLTVGGNVTATGPNVFSGTVGIKLTGNSSGQTVSSVSGGSIPNLTIEAGTNSVTFGSAVIVTGSYTVNSVGTFTTTGSTLTLSGVGSTYPIKTGSETYNNVSLSSQNTTYNLGGSTMNVAGDLSISNNGSGGTINSGTFAVAGNVTSTGPGTFSGTGTIQLTGNASGQTVSTPSGGSVAGLTMNAGTNTVTLSGTVMVRGSYIVTSVGTLVTTGSTLYFVGNCTNITITPGNYTYNNVTFGGACATYSLGGSTMTIAGDLTFGTTTYANPINSGTLAVSGNIIGVSGSYTGGSVGIRLEGTGDQTITSAATVLPAGPVTVNKSSGNVILASNFSQSSTWTLTTGTIYMSGYSFTLSGLALSGNTIHLKDTGATSSAGVLKVNGTTYGIGSYLGGTVAN